MNCKNCGAELDENAVFCGNCGVKLEIEQPVAEETVCEEYDQEVNTECQQECCGTPVILEEPKSAAVPAEKPSTASVPRLLPDHCANAIGYFPAGPRTPAQIAAYRSAI